MPKAVQFGAGNIGRGFVGQLYSESGYEVVYVDVDDRLINSLNARGSYPLRLVDSGGAVENLTIGPVRAVNGNDHAAVARELATADIAGTSVGVNALRYIAAPLAAGIDARAEQSGGPLNILLCENQWHAASALRKLLDPLMSPRAVAYAERNLGLVETVIGRMVPAPSDETLAEDGLLVVAEPYKRLPISRAQIVGPEPVIVGVEPADRFDAYEARKLFLHNAGHAALAYLAYPNHEYIWQAAQDDEARATCLAALTEAGLALVADYEFDTAAIVAFAQDLVRRFENKALGDTVARVAADPLRKLRPDDRLVGAAKLCLKHGIPPVALAKVLAAALRYDNPDDASSVALQKRLRDEGFASFLSGYCQISEGSPLYALVDKEIER
jgi:mannitol-1-phosphate 5-dehydrogenase